MDQTLTADTAAIADEDGLDDVNWRYQWLAAGSDIAGTTGASYELTSSEQGQTIQVRVSFSDDRGNAETLTSVATAEVTAKPAAEPQNPPPSPTSLTATVTADGHIVLSWTVPDDDSVTGYRILRRRLIVPVGHH